LFFYEAPCVIQKYCVCLPVKNQFKLGTGPPDWVGWLLLTFTVRLHVMQCSVLLSQFCPSVCQTHVLWQN